MPPSSPPERAAGRWEVVHLRGPAGPFHRRDPTVPPRPAAQFLEVTAPALVLGSTQMADVVDVAGAGAAAVEVVQRRSGGGAVLLRPDDLVWVDVVLPAGDALWCADVGRSFHWLGAVWAEALGDLGFDATWHDGPPVRTRLSSWVCFAGVGQGEVTVGGRKVVGISQRRTRSAALFQCGVLLRWDPAALLALLRLPAADADRAGDELAEAAAGLGRSPADVEGAFLRRLSTR